MFQRAKNKQHLQRQKGLDDQNKINEIEMRNYN